jgi:hypothetical protein
MVNLDHPDLVVVADTTEGPDQVTWLNRATGPSGEHQTIVLPCTAEVGAVATLRFASYCQRVSCYRQQRQITAASVRLDRRYPQLTSDTLELLTDADLPIVFVDIVPAHAEYLASAEPI